MNKADYIFGALAFVGAVVFILSLIIGLLHDLHRLWNWLAGNTGTTTRAKITVEEMYESTPYAATRNAKQSITKGGKP